MTQMGIWCIYCVMTCFYPGIFVMDISVHRYVLLFFFKKYEFIIRLSMRYRD